MIKIQIQLVFSDSYLYDIVGRYYIDNANWGVYTKNQIAAEGLAYMLGCVNPVSEFTRGTGGYEHYHDPKHIIHIWYGVHY